MSAERTTTDPVPLPASPNRADTLLPPSRTGSDDVGGMPTTTTSGVQARQDENGDAAQGTVRPAAPAGAAPEVTGTATATAAGTATTAPGFDAPAASAGRSSGGDGADVGEHGADHGSDDGLLESIGKAISSPIGAAAEDDDVAQTGQPHRPASGSRS